MDWNAPKVPKGFIRRMKCLFGYHEWRDTGIRSHYGFVYFFECVHCGVQIDRYPDEISFETIGGQECMVIRR